MSRFFLRLSTVILATLLSRTPGLAHFEKATDPMISSSVLLITHAADTWDRGTILGRSQSDGFLPNKIRPALKKVIFTFLKQQRPILNIVSPDEEAVEKQNPIFNSVATTASEDGSHSSFFGANSFIVTGGNLTMCSCATVRPTLENELKLGPKKLSFYFITDAIYDYFSVPGLEQLSPNEHRLDLIMKYLNDDQFQKFLTKVYLDSGYLCGESLNLPFHVNFRIFREGQFLFSFGVGSQIIDLHFLNWQQFHDADQARLLNGHGTCRNIDPRSPAVSF